MKEERDNLIKTLYQTGRYSQEDLAKMFRVDQSNISRAIAHGDAVETAYLRDVAETFILEEVRREIEELEKFAQLIRDAKWTKVDPKTIQDGRPTKTKEEEDEEVLVALRKLLMREKEG